MFDGKSCWCVYCRGVAGKEWKDHAQRHSEVPIQASAGGVVDDNYVSGALTWLEENPGTQLMTGSFHPLPPDEWERDALHAPAATGPPSVAPPGFSQPSSQLLPTQPQGFGSQLLFGQIQQQTQQQSLFGQQSQPTGFFGSGLFGQSQTPSTSLFGQSQPPPTSLFGPSHAARFDSLFAKGSQPAAKVAPAAKPANKSGKKPIKTKAYIPDDELDEQDPEVLVAEIKRLRGMLAQFGMK